MSTINPLTGLPLLPKGYFFRVRVHGCRVYLTVREKFFLIMSQDIDERYVGDVDKGPDLLKEEIKLDAAYLHGRLVARLAREKKARDYRASIDNLLGDYPPKVLGEAQNTPKRIE